MIWQLLRDRVVWRLLLAALCAAVVLVEHVRFALRAARPRPEEREAQERHGVGLRAAAWVVPGLGAVLAWRAGARVAPVVFALSVVGWLALRPWS